MPTFSVSKDRAVDAAAEVLAVPVFEGLALGPGAKEVEAAIGITVAELSEQLPVIGKPDAQFTGALGQAIITQSNGLLGATHVMFVGLGERADAKTPVARKAGATVARRIGGARTVATTIPQAVKGGADKAVGAFVEGLLLGSYRFLKYKAASNGRPNRIEGVALLSAKGWDTRKINQSIDRGTVLAEATMLARDLKNTPSLDKGPETLAEAARSIAKGTALTVRVFDEKELAAKGFGGILGVGSGSARPPRLVEINYTPSGAKKTIALVGKGITFDSGGISLKPAKGMDAMKMDMGGAAAVIGAMKAIAALKPKVAVRGYVATAENLPGGNAIRPGDVLKHYGGITSEVGNTDAEGRLVLADAIVYAKERGADVVIDIATLTGACMIALGHKVFGVIGEPRTETKKVLDAADRAGEAAWELPLHKEYRSALESTVADISNIATKDVGGGAITAALFLKEFVGDTPWVHLDIAGPMRSAEDDFEKSKAATGVGVRTLVEYVLAQ